MDAMPDLIQIGIHPSKPAYGCAQKTPPRTRVFWFQGVTLVWMVIEFGVSAYAAITAHSPAMLAFGSDSLVELMSATVVLFAVDSGRFCFGTQGNPRSFYAAVRSCCCCSGDSPCIFSSQAPA